MRNEAHRLYIDGVASPIVAERLERRGGGATMEQRLPFLEIGTVVADDDGNTYVIRAVDLEVRGGVPRLIVDLDPEDSQIRPRPEAPGLKAARGSTQAFERPQLLAAREMVISDTPPPPAEAEEADVVPMPPPMPVPAATAGSAITTRDLLRSAPPAVRHDVEEPHPSFLVTKVDRYGFAVERFLLEAWRHVREAIDGYGRVIDRLVSL